MSLFLNASSIRVHCDSLHSTIPDFFVGCVGFVGIVGFVGFVRLYVGRAELGLL